MGGATSSCKTIDISQFGSLDLILGRNSVHEQVDYELVRAVMEIGLNHSKSGVAFNRDLLRGVKKWEIARAASVTLFGISTARPVYTSIAAAAKWFKTYDECKRCKEREHQFMKRTIPLSYAIWGAIFFALAIAFSLLLILGLATGHYLVDPWFIFMCCIGSFGMTATVVVATLDWRRKLDGEASPEDSEEK